QTGLTAIFHSMQTYNAGNSPGSVLFFPDVYKPGKAGITSSTFKPYLHAFKPKAQPPTVIHPISARYYIRLNGSVNGSFIRRNAGGYPSLVQHKRLPGLIIDN